MAIKIDFDRRKTFWQIAHRGSEANRALAFEACATLFTQLQEAVSRLQDTLLDFSESKIPFDAFLTLGDIHQIIDISHRVYNLYPLMVIQPSAQTQERIDTVAALHRSLEGLPEILSDFIAKNSNAYSVLGDFQWRHRANIEEAATVYLFKGSILKAGAETQITLSGQLAEDKSQLDRFDGHTGVFGVEFIYLKKILAQDGSISFGHSSLILDDLIDKFNNLIQSIESNYSKLIQAQMNANPEWVTDLNSIEPHIIIINPK